MRDAGVAAELMGHFDAIARRFMREGVSRAAGEIPLTRHEFRVLDLLGDTGQRPMGELARELGLAMSSLTAIADRMVAKNLMERVRPEHDRRVVLGRLTSVGRKMSDQMRRNRLRAAREMIAALPAADRDQFLRMMRTIRETLTKPAGGGGA